MRIEAAVPLPQDFSAAVPYDQLRRYFEEKQFTAPFVVAKRVYTLDVRQLFGEGLAARSPDTKPAKVYIGSRTPSHSTMLRAVLRRLPDGEVFMYWPVRREGALCVSIAIYLGYAPALALHPQGRKNDSKGRSVTLAFVAGFERLEM